MRNQKVVRVDPVSKQVDFKLVSGGEGGRAERTGPRSGRTSKRRSKKKRS